MKRIIAIVLALLILFTASCSFKISPRLFYDLWETKSPETTLPSETTAAPETTKVPETTAAPETTSPPNQTVTPIIKEYQKAKKPAEKLNLTQLSDRLAESMKIHRSLLSDAEKDIYDRIEKSMRLYTDVKIPIPSGMQATYEKIYWAVQLDSPELMMSVYKIGLTNNPGTVEAWALKHTTDIDGRDVRSYTRDLIYKADCILAEMPDGLSTREKYVWIADYICNNVDISSKNTSGITTNEKFAGGALMSGYSSTNGYRQAYVLLCQRAGLWCTIANYRDKLYDGVVLVKFDDGETYYMYIYEADDVSPYFRESVYFKTETDVRLKAKLNDRTLAATGTDPYKPEATVSTETADVPTVTDPEFEAFMSLDGLSEDAKAFFRAAKEKSGYKIIGGTLIVENGSIGFDDHDNFRAVYGEGTAEMMEYVDAVREIGYWFVNPGALSPDPQGKIETLYNRYYFAPIEVEAFKENNIHDPDSLRAFLETKFTDRIVEQLMRECADGMGEAEYIPPIAYYEGKLYAYVGGHHAGNSFNAEFFIKENTRERISVVCQRKARAGMHERDTDYEIVFVREGDTWLCDQLPNIWQDGAGKVSTTRAAYTESYEISHNINTSELLANAESHHYEEYPGCNSVPYSAVLWQDGVSTYIDVNDPRLIMLVNMYHNSVYNSKYAWTQGCLDNATYQKYVYAPVRLELTFKWEGGPSYDKHDKIIVSCPEGKSLGGGFVVICSGSETYTDAPEWAMIRFPYSLPDMDWIRLVGFVE